MRLLSIAFVASWLAQNVAAEVPNKYLSVGLLSVVCQNDAKNANEDFYVFSKEGDGWISIAGNVTNIHETAEGFTLLFPSFITGITIVACMYALSMVMKNIPMGITYASFAGLTIISTVIVGVIRFNQILNFYSVVGLILIIAGVLMVNLLGNK